MKKFKDDLSELLSSAGIKVNGDAPWDVRINDENMFSMLLINGSLGLGESYMDGWWDCHALDEASARLLSQFEDRLHFDLRSIIQALLARFLNFQAKNKAYDIGEAHYDLGNDLFQNMLDKRLVYTCGYWKDTKTLDEAQESKLELVCQKLGLMPGDRILDIGCGWGSFLKYAAEKHGVKGVGITVSNEQVRLGNKLCEGLPVEIRYQDYRDVDEKFSHVVSLGMFEHVGYKNYRTFMKAVYRCLNDHGLFLLHTIGGNKSSTSIDPWLNKYIFPQGMIPSIRQIGNSIEGLFIMEDWHNFGADYDKTLIAWYDNFEKNWDKLKSKYDERFFRMWRYFLLTCAGTFRARKNQLWQIVLSKTGRKGYYRSIR